MASITSLVARAPEREAIERLLESREPVARALVLDGIAGIGKTTLVHEASAVARASGFDVLACSPGEAEGQMAFAALGDLIDPGDEVTAAALAAMEETPRHTLLRAAGREESVAGLDVLSVSRAFASFLGAVAERPLLLAIDDAQWLDEPSDHALTFALRRVSGRPLRILITRRNETPRAAPLGLERSPAVLTVETRRVGPMSVVELDELLRAKLNLNLSRPRLEAVHKISGGNPLYALEIGRSLRDEDASDDGGVRVPESLGGLLAERLMALPRVVNDAVLLAALAPRPTADLVTEAAGTSEGVRAAIGAGLLTVHGERLQFTHPLLAGVAIESALPAELRSAHERLAEHCADSVTRALHLAQAATKPDPDLAEALENAASLAAERGSHSVAATLARAATALSGEEDAATRRRRAAEATYRSAAGDPRVARAILTSLIDETPRGVERAAYLCRLAETVGDDIDASIRLSEQALEEADGDDALLAEIHTSLGVFTWLAGDLRRSTQHIEAAANAARRSGDEQALAIALGELCHAQAVLGIPFDAAAMEQAIAIESRSAGLPAGLRPSFQLGIVLMYNDRLDEARPLLESELERIRETGDERARVGALFRLAELELRAGGWDRASAYARESSNLARQAAIEQEQSVGLMIDALVRAHVGDLESAREQARRAYGFADAAGDVIVRCRAAGILGFVALSEPDPEEALAWLEPASNDLRRLGVGELCISQVANNEIEALIAVKRLDDAEDRILWVERAGASTGRAWHRVVAARGRALVAAARGDAGDAALSLQAALAAGDELPQPFERARTLLAAGAIEKRFRRWASARGHFERALELMDLLGAARWSERAAAEIGRLPGRPRVTRDGDAISETERAIARLVAEGLSNKEIAARMYVTVRTVETHLTRLYAKLRLRSRAELARAVADWPPSG